MKTAICEKYEEYFSFLDDLRESGSINMFGAGPYLREEFNLSKNESYEILADWQITFEARMLDKGGEIEMSMEIDWDRVNTNDLKKKEVFDRVAEVQVAVS